MLDFVRPEEPPVLSWPAIAADIALAAVATVAALRFSAVSSPGLPWLVMLGVALTAASLAVRRRYPVTAFWVMLAAVFATSRPTSPWLVVDLSLQAAHSPLLLRGWSAFSGADGGRTPPGCGPGGLRPLMQQALVIQVRGRGGESMPGEPRPHLGLSAWGVHAEDPSDLRPPCCPLIEAVCVEVLNGHRVNG